MPVSSAKHNATENSFKISSRGRGICRRMCLSFTKYQIFKVQALYEEGYQFGIFLEILFSNIFPPRKLVS